MIRYSVEDHIWQVVFRDTMVIDEIIINAPAEVRKIVTETVEFVVDDAVDRNVGDRHGIKDYLENG